jgi:hypothetical protein
MRQVVQQWCATAFERLERDGCIVRRALLPTAIEEAQPCECQGPHGGLRRLALVTLLLVIALCPEGMPDRCRGPCYDRVSSALRTLEAPVHPGFFAAAFRHWRDTRICLVFLSRGEVAPLFAKGHEEAGSKDGSGAWQGSKHGAVGMALGAWRHGVVDVCNRLHSDAALGDEGVHQEGVGDDAPCIRGQRHSTLDGLDAGRDDVGRAHVVGTEKALQCGGRGRQHSKSRAAVARQEHA